MFFKGIVLDGSSELSIFTSMILPDSFTRPSGIGDENAVKPPSCLTIKLPLMLISHW